MPKIITLFFSHPVVCVAITKCCSSPKAAEHTIDRKHSLMLVTLNGQSDVGRTKLKKEVVADGKVLEKLNNPCDHICSRPSLINQTIGTKMFFCFFFGRSLKT